MRHSAPLFKHAEDRKDLPAAFADLDTLPLVQNTGYVLVESTAGDMAYSMNIALADHVEHLLDIDLGRCEEHVAEQASAERRNGVEIAETCVGDDLADQAEAV